MSRSAPGDLAAKRPVRACEITAVLREDPELAAGMGGARRRAAERSCLAMTTIVGAGAAPEPNGDVVAGIGLLVLEGFILMRVGARGRYGAHVFGQGDLLRPWEFCGREAALRFDTSVQALAPSRLALLDERFARRAARFPEVAGALVGRAARRSRDLAVNLAIVHHPTLEARLLMLLWHLAAQWGSATSQGVRVPLPLTHEMLADMVAAQRQSVSTTLARLARDGVISRTRPGWTLHGEPPFERRRGPLSVVALR